MKNCYLSCCKWSGAFEKAKRRNAKRLLVLCYHSVVGNDAPVNSRTNIAVSSQQFESQLKLINRDWTPVSLADVEKACYENVPLPDHAVMLTFDDGFRNNYTLAAPLLKKYDVPAVVFITTDLISHRTLLWPQEVRERIIDGAENQIPDTENGSFLPVPPNVKERERLADQMTQRCKTLSHQARSDYLEKLRNVTKLDLETPWKEELYEFMSWDEVRDIRNFGVTLGAHTVSHPILSSLSLENLQEELSLCKKKIEFELDEECCSFAYPNGGKADFNETVIEEAKKVGFRIAFNLYERRNPETLEPFSIDRFCITRDISLLEFERLLACG